MKKKLLLFIIILALPAFFYAHWVLNHSLYPKNDEAAYFTVTQETYLTFKYDGFLEGFEAAYTHRHWKPIFHQIAAVPILALTNGDTRNAVFIYSGLCYFLLIAGIFSFLYNKLNEAFLIPATLIIALMPWVYGMSTTFNSEIGFATATIWFFYCWHDYGIFSSKRNASISASLLFLMFILRPVEAALVAVLLVASSLYDGHKKKTIFVGDLINLLIWVVLFLGAIFLCLQNRTNLIIQNLSLIIVQINCIEQTKMCKFSQPYFFYPL
jgi:hypothetical protein